MAFGKLLERLEKALDRAHDASAEVRAVTDELRKRLSDLATIFAPAAETLSEFEEPQRGLGTLLESPVVKGQPEGYSCPVCGKEFPPMRNKPGSKRHFRRDYRMAAHRGAAHGRKKVAQSSKGEPISVE